MNPSRKYVLTAMLVVLSLYGCKKTDSDGGEGGAPAMPPSTAPAVASAPPSGRCKVQTPDVPYDTLFFFPERKEFMARMEGGVAIEPLVVTKATPEQIEFTTKPWVDPDKSDAPTTQAGTLAFTKTKWSFDFERSKDADCVVDDFALTYKPLTEAGIKAGTWSSKETSFSMTFLADGQRFIQKRKNDEKVIHYRIVDKTDAGVVIGTSGTPPSSASGDIWSTITLTPVGEKLNVAITGVQLMLSYAGPPPSASSGVPAGREEAVGGTKAATANAPAVVPARAAPAPAPTVSAEVKACCDAVSALGRETGAANVKAAAGRCKLQAEGGQGDTIKPMVQRLLSCASADDSCTSTPIPAACR